MWPQFSQRINTAFPTVEEVEGCYCGVNNKIRKYVSKGKKKLNLSFVNNDNCCIVAHMSFCYYLTNVVNFSYPFNLNYYCGVIAVAALRWSDGVVGV